MSNQRIEWSLKLGEALLAFKEGRYDDADRLAKEAAQKASVPEIGTIAGYLEARVQEEKGEDPKALFDAVSKATDSCADNNAGALFIGVAGSPTDSDSLGIEYDCTGLHNAAKRFEEVKVKTIRHTPDNLRPLTERVKFEPGLKKNMTFSPDLFSGVHYIRQNVFNTYDPARNEWISTPRNLKVYDVTSGRPTHHYQGFIEPQNRSPFYYDKSDLFVLPVPDGFVLDGKSVALDGNQEGFEILQDADGLFYLRMTEGKRWTKPQVEFDLVWEGGDIHAVEVVESRPDLLPGTSLSKKLKDLKSEAQFYGAAEKYGVVRNFIVEELKYPDNEDILNGDAIYARANGRDFYFALAHMKLADCDVANSYGVILLRKMGVPARLVTGFYIDNRGIGRHGWLEYWDDHQKMWVRGDMTPPLGREEKPKTEDRRPRTKSTETEKVFPEFIPFRLREKMRVDVDTDLYWTFEGENFVLSEPSGRYLMSSKNPGNGILKVYDLEYNRFLSAPIPGILTEALFCRTSHLYETVKSFLIETDCSDVSVDSVGPYFLWDQSGKVLAVREEPYGGKNYNFISQYPPFFVDIVGINKGFYHKKHLAKEVDNKLHLLIVGEEKPGKWPLYRFVFDEKSEIVPKPIAILPYHLYSSGPHLQFSPDASHFLVQPDPSSKELIVFRNDKELYRFSFERFWHMEAMDQYAPAVKRYDTLDFRLYNDGSLDIKQVGDNEAMVIHVNPDGKEDVSRRIVREATQNWSDGSDENLLDIDWNGEWSLRQRIGEKYFTRNDDPIMRNVTEDSCIQKDDSVRCLGERGHTIYNPIIKGRGKFSLYHPNLHISQWDSLPPHLRSLPLFVRTKGTTNIHKRDRYSAWEIDLQEGEPEVKFKARQHAAVAVSVQDPIAIDLKEVLKNNPEPTLVRQYMGYLADHPEADIFHEWLLLGAAVIFKDYENCIEADGIPGCEESLKETAKFMEDHGSGLASRYSGHIYESSYFKNEGVVVRAWALMLTGATMEKRPQILQKMIGTDVDKTAQAVVLALEMGMMTPSEIPAFSFIEEDLLTVSLKNILSKRFEKAIQQMRQVATGYSGALFQYQYRHLEGLLYERFGSSALPQPHKKNW